MSIDILPRISDAAEWLDLLAVVVFVGGQDDSVVLAAAGICSLLTLADDEVCFLELITPKLT